MSIKTGNARINLILRRVLVTTVAVEKQEALSILSVCLKLLLSRIQCACAVLYCHLWPVWFHCIFPHYFICGTILGKSSFTWNVSFDFSLQYLSEIFPTLRRNGRDIILNVPRSSHKVPARVVRFTARIFLTDFRKTLKYQIISW